MMALGPHAAFIVAAYAITLVVVVVLIAWVMLDHRAQARALADLDARGVRRRSESAHVSTA
jgi:heme exporter protein D